MIDSLKSTLQPVRLPDHEGNLLAIDGDGLPYMFGWQHKDHREIEIVHQAIDKWIDELFLLLNARKYIGVLSSGGKCFRYDIYKVRQYKGTRKEKNDESMEWFNFWEPAIRKYLFEKYGFVPAPEWVETDDVIAHLGYTLPGRVLMCSPDKDLKQIPGFHIDYRKVGTEQGKIEEISEKEAKWRWCMQMLSGDQADNIVGIPGMGPKKGEILLNKAAEMLSFHEAAWHNAVKLAYQEYYGNYYGNLIYLETEAVVTMVIPAHPLWYRYKFDVEKYTSCIRTCEHDRPIFFEAL